MAFKLDADEAADCTPAESAALVVGPGDAYTARQPMCDAERGPHNQTMMAAMIGARSQNEVAGNKKKQAKGKLCL